MSTPPKLSDQVAANVRAEMAAQKKTAIELSALLGIGHGAALRRCNGDIQISLNELDQIASWLGVSRASLMTERSRLAAVAS